MNRDSLVFHRNLERVKIPRIAIRSPWAHGFLLVQPCKHIHKLKSYTNGVLSRLSSVGLSLQQPHELHGVGRAKSRMDVVVHSLSRCSTTNHCAAAWWVNVQPINLSLWRLSSEWRSRSYGQQPYMIAEREEPTDARSFCSQKTYQVKSDINVPSHLFRPSTLDFVLLTAECHYVSASMESEYASHLHRMLQLFSIIWGLGANTRLGMHNMVRFTSTTILP